MAEWMRNDGHDVLEARTLGPDPGDRILLERANSEDRILVTIDTDFGELIYLHDVPHAGLVRLPDVPADQRLALAAEVINRHRQALEDRAVVTIRGGANSDFTSANALNEGVKVLPMEPLVQSSNSPEGGPGGPVVQPGRVRHRPGAGGCRDCAFRLQ